LQRVVFDQEMLGAGIEIYKVGTDITNKLDVFGEGEKLPAKVARDALAPSGGGKVVATVSVGAAPPPEPTPVPEGDRVVHKDTPKATPVEDKPVVAKTEKTDKPEVRKVTASSGEPEMIPIVEPLGPGEERKAQAASGSKTWIWIVVAVVVVAAGGGVGAYFGIREGTKPITGTGTITW
jgi:hypothetical protein